MLFPQLGSSFSEESDNYILAKMSNFYKESITINQSFWAEAEMDTRFNAGDQSLWNELYAHIPSARGKEFNFNRIRRVTNMISGQQRKNRKSTIVTPVENGDEQTADQFSKLLMWINQQEGVLETVSDAFHGSLVTGMNLLQVWVDYRTDPVSGNIKVDSCDYNSFLIDPFFKKKDLSDCNGIWKRSYLTKNEAISLLPDHEDTIENINIKEARDGKFQHMPESFNFNLGSLLPYDEFYYKTYRKQNMLIDSQTGETLEWQSNDQDRLNEFLRIYPSVTIVKQEVPTVNLAIVISGNVLYDGPNPLGIDNYPFVPILGYYNPQMSDYSSRIQGVVRGLRDAQYLYNRRKTIELDILESQVASGWIYKEDALVNPKDIFMSGQGKGLALKDTAQMTDVQQIVAPQIPPSMIQLSELLGKEIQEISGVNEELLGSAMDDKAGVLSMLRQGAGLTTLQGLFDNLDHAQKLLGKIMINVVQNNFTPGKVQRIIEEQPSKQFYNKAFGKYDAAVEDGLNTTTQRQMQFAQLLQLKEAGVAIPDDVLLDAATVQNKAKLTESIKAANEAKQQMEQMQMQSALKEEQARTELAQARTLADKGLGLERISRIEENQALAVERRAEAKKDEDQALLNMVKALKEIDDIDLNQMERLVTLSRTLRGEGEVPASTSASASASTSAAISSVMAPKPKAATTQPTV